MLSTSRLAPHKLEGRTSGPRRFSDTMIIIPHMGINCMSIANSNKISHDSPCPPSVSGRHAPENDPYIAATFTVTPICISAHEAETGAAITKTAEERKSRTCGTGALIHKQGSPYWYAKWWQNGRQFCVSTEEAAKMKAEQSLQRFMGRKAVGLPIPEVLKLRYENPRNSLMEN